MRISGAPFPELTWSISLRVRHSLSSGAERESYSAWGERNQDKLHLLSVVDAVVIQRDEKNSSGAKKEGRWKIVSSWSALEVGEMAPRWREANCRLIKNEARYRWVIVQLMWLGVKLIFRWYSWNLQTNNKSRVSSSIQLAVKQNSSKKSSTSTGTKDKI